MKRTTIRAKRVTSRARSWRSVGCQRLESTARHTTSRASIIPWNKTASDSNLYRINDRAKNRPKPTTRTSDAALSLMLEQPAGLGGELGAAGLDHPLVGHEGARGRSCLGVRLLELDAARSSRRRSAIRHLIYHLRVERGRSMAVRAHGTGRLALLGCEERNRPGRRQMRCTRRTRASCLLDAILADRGDVSVRSKASTLDHLAAGSRDQSFQDVRVDLLLDGRTEPSRRAH